MLPVTTTSASSATRFIIIFAAIVVVIAGLKAADELVVPFVLSVFIAVISAPPPFLDD